MRNGVAQAKYEVSLAIDAQTPEEQKQRLERASTVLSAWQEAYGEPARIINDNSFYPVLEEMNSEKGIMTTIKEIINKSLGGFDYWEEILGVLTAVLSGIGVKLYSANRRHRREKSVMIKAIEKSANTELKTQIAKSIANSTPFGFEVQRTLQSGTQTPLTYKAERV
jgi:hypothetical protein